MNLSDEGIGLIARWEGVRNEWYKDALGVWTIGIGHVWNPDTDADFADRSLSTEEVWALFRKDVQRYVDSVNHSVWVPLSQRQFDACVSFAFNWGISSTTGFPATSVVELVNAGDFDGAATELVEGKGPSGRPYDKGLQGVRNRRIEEAEWLRQGREPMSAADIIRAAMADLEAQGVGVDWIGGWEDRGRSVLRPQGVVCHHTATKAYDRDYPSLGIVRDGRSDLPGPLSQFGLGRHSGNVIVIAAGTANHAGPGGWGGLSGNSTVWGIEAENDGIGEEWQPHVLRNYVLLCAALARHTGFDSSFVCGHREWSDYKIDPTGIDMDWFRAEVQRLLDGGAPSEGDEDLKDEERDALFFVRDTLSLFFEPLADEIGPDGADRYNGAKRGGENIRFTGDAVYRLVSRGGKDDAYSGADRIAHILGDLDKRLTSIEKAVKTKPTKKTA